MRIAWVVDEAKDNVATILAEGITAGTEIPIEIQGKTLKVKANADIPYGHKVAIKPIRRGETVYKYGLSIGRASQDIAVGDWVHVHNVESNRGRGDLARAAMAKEAS